jgi:hypothetical protein
VITRRRLVLAIALGSLLALPASVSAATPISVQVLTGQPCVSGIGPANKKVTATLRTPAGKIRDRVMSESDDVGGWGVCFGLFFPSTNINGGDVLNVVVGARSRTIHIPRLEPMIDRVTNVIEGEADPFAPVDMLISHRNNFKTSEEFGYSTTADGSGHYAVDTTADFNLLGGDAVTVITSNGDDLFGAIALAPFLEIQNANNDVQGTVNRGTQVDLLLTDENAVEKAHVHAGPFLFGIFQVEMYADDGSAAYTDRGDWLTANIATDAALHLPVSSLHGTASDDVITGRCMPNAPYTLNARTQVFFGTTDSTGRLTRDVTSRMNLRRTDHLALACMYPTGDIWLRTGFVE